MENKNNQSGSSKQRATTAKIKRHKIPVRIEGENETIIKTDPPGDLLVDNPIVYVKAREKIEYEIHEIIRAYPDDYQRIMDSFEAWAKQFD